VIPTHIVIHHSATATDITAQQIREEHLKRGWDDIGYHFVIAVDGSIEKGRNEDVVGAHALGINQHSLGICCIGNFQIHDIPHAQLAALQTLVEELSLRYSIPAAQIIGHCDVTCEERGGRRSQCPGKFLYEKMSSIRQPR